MERSISQIRRAVSVGSASGICSRKSKVCTIPQG
jgi:hypothetical protein